MDDLLIAVRAIIALAAVLGLLWFLSRRLQQGQATNGNPLSGLAPKKFLRFSAQLRSRTVRGVPAQREERITVIARSNLGAKAQLVVAEFGGIRYVLGVTERGVSVVDTQETPVEEDLPHLADSQHDVEERARTRAEIRRLSDRRHARGYEKLPLSR